MRMRNGEIPRVRYSSCLSNLQGSLIAVNGVEISAMLSFLWSELIASINNEITTLDLFKNLDSRMKVNSNPWRSV